ncbi:hypothetical protein Q1695_002934 [Nippostrongylus brasiliensis]|nr:hypothetical protein Q1695_002934 [Nippostrongylus brasiliensis]
MVKLATLFVLLVAADVAFSTQKCNKGNDEQLPLFERVHQHMNLTLDCYAVTNALHAAYLLMWSKPDHINKQYWCMYSTYTWSYSAWEGSWVKDVPLKEIPFDKVAQTALLHPRTKYGCGARLYRGEIYIWFTLVCIYQKKAPQHLCKVPWSLD